MGFLGDIAHPVTALTAGVPGSGAADRVREGVDTKGHREEDSNDLRYDEV